MIDYLIPKHGNKVNRKKTGEKNVQFVSVEHINMFSNVKKISL